MIKTCTDRTKDSQFFLFSKNINNSIRWYLKDAVCIRSFDVNYSDTQSCSPHCTTLRKYDLWKYFKTRGRTSVNKHVKCALSYSCTTYPHPISLLQSQHKMSVGINNVFSSNVLTLLFHSVYLCFILDLRRDNNKHNCIFSYNCSVSSDITDKQF